MGQLEDAIEIKRQDYCPNCKRERALECYNNKGEPIQYSIYVDKKLSGQDVVFKNKGYITVMKCTKCGTKYIIDWTGSFPKPLLYQAFFAGFMKNYQ